MRLAKAGRSVYKLWYIDIFTDRSDRLLFHIILILWYIVILWHIFGLSWNPTNMKRASGYLYISYIYTQTTTHLYQLIWKITYSAICSFECSLHSSFGVKRLVLWGDNIVQIWLMGEVSISESCRVTEKETLDRSNGPLARYVILRVAHAPGMPGTFSPPPRVSDPDMHHGTCVTHLPWCMSGSLTSVFLWSRGRGKRSRYFRRTWKPQYYVSGKRPIDCVEHTNVVVSRWGIKTPNCWANAQFMRNGTSNWQHFDRSGARSNQVSLIGAE